MQLYCIESTFVSKKVVYNTFCFSIVLYISHIYLCMKSTFVQINRTAADIIESDSYGVPLNVNRDSVGEDMCILIYLKKHSK